jgi:hypothetical protein
LRNYKSPGSDQFSAPPIEAGGKRLLFAIHELVNSIWNKEELPGQWKQSIILPI